MCVFFISFSYPQILFFPSIEAREEKTKEEGNEFTPEIINNDLTVNNGILSSIGMIV